MKISSLDIKKYCVNSLFIPYNITLLNIQMKIKKKKDYRKINFAGFDVIYLVLNKSMYNLFFQRKKGNVFGSKNQIMKKIIIF